jgi:recombination protein RecA
VQKRFGTQSVSVASDIPQPRRISTGSFILDFALLGGIPESRATMIVGEKHGGKSMLATKIAANAQRMYPHKTPVYIDVEGTFDATWARKLGVDIDSMPVIQCDSGEMAVDVTDAVIGSEETSLVIVDSIAALTPMKEIQDSAEDQHVGLQARLVGRMVRKASAALVRERIRGHMVTLLFINQFRSKIGVTYGDPRSIPGGRALEYCATIQLIMKNKENKGKDSTTGIDAVETNEHAFTITKNKLNGGPRSGEFNLIRVGDREGVVDDGRTLLAYAKKFGVYSGGGSKWQVELPSGALQFGKAEEAVEALREDPEFYTELRNYVISLQAVNLGMPEEFIEGIGR